MLVFARRFADIKSHSRGPSRLAPATHEVSLASELSFITRLVRLPGVRKVQGWVTSMSLANIKYVLFISALALLGCFTILNQIFISGLKTQALEINDKEARLYAVAIAEQLN